MKRLLRFAVAFAAAAALALLPIKVEKVLAAASTQTLHAVMCQAEPSVGTAGPRRVVNPNTGNAYTLNGQGCATIAFADVGYFLSQGFTYGPNIFMAQVVGVTASGTASVTLPGITLPAYAQILSIVIEETAGNAVTGGLNIGNAGGATGIASAVAVAANGTATVADSALNAGRIYSPAGVPTATTVAVAAVTSWNNAVVNVSITYAIY